MEDTLTATVGGLLAGFAHADRRIVPVVLDPVTGSVAALAVDAQGTDCPSPAGRYVARTSSDGWIVRDAGAPDWPIVSRSAVGSRRVLPLVEAGLVVRIDDRFRQLRFHALDGTLVRSIGGLGLSRSWSTAMFAPPRARSVLTWSSDAPVRRWPVPSGV